MSECQHCKELEEQVYRLLGELQAVNLKLTLMSRIRELKSLVDDQIKEQEDAKS